MLYGTMTIIASARLNSPPDQGLTLFDRDTSDLFSS